MKILKPAGICLLSLTFSQLSIVDVNAQGNDNCSSAITQVLPLGGSLTLTGNNTNATSTNDWAPGSSFAGAPVIWHSFSISGCATVTVEYCGLSPAWGNVFGILSTDCPASNTITFSNTSTTACGDGNTTYSWNNLAPGTYKLPVVKDVAQNSVGPYSLQLSAVACNNDFCGNVYGTPLAVGQTVTFTGNVDNATPTGDFPTSSPFAGAPVKWHAITTATCADITISYCSQTTVWGTVFGFMSTDCPADALVQFSTTSTCTNGNVIYVWDELPAGTYYIPVVLDAANGSAGPYSIAVSAANCFNDNCANAIATNLAVGSTLNFTGDNTNATGTGDFVPGSSFEGAPVVWHAFTTAQCANIRVSFCGQAQVFGNVFGFLSTDCPANNIIQFSNVTDTECGDGNVIYGYDNVPAGTYYVPVVLDAGQGSVGPYSINVSATGCVYDQCNNVQPEVLAPGTSLVFNGNVNSATPTGDFPTASPFAGAPVLWHSFTTNACADVTINYCGQVPVFGTVFGFLSLDCPASNMVQFTSFSETACGDGNILYFYDNLPAGTYLMPVVLDPANGNSGVYNVNVVATGCFVGVNELSTEEFSVYPNPATDQLTIVYGGTDASARIEMMDLSGRVVVTEKRSLINGNTYQINLPTGLTPGTYVLRIRTENGSLAKRVVVE